MGKGHSKEADNILEAILTNREADIEMMLRKDSNAVNAPLLNGIYVWVFVNLHILKSMLIIFMLFLERK